MRRKSERYNKEVWDNKSSTEVEGLEDYRAYAIKAAKELLYPKDVIAQIRNAETKSGISNILKSARLRDL